MKRKNLIGKVFRSALMGLGIVALLAIYIITVSDLPSGIYTDTQREFLAYNQLRSIQQSAPTLKFELGDSMSVEEGRLLPVMLPWQKSRVKATLQALYEEEGGVSVAVYDLTFKGAYDLTHTGDFTATVDLFFPFPANLETYHEVTFLVDGKEPEDAVFSTAGISWQTQMAPGGNFAIEISYRAEGANSFSYGLMQNQRTDIDITVDLIGLPGATTAKGSLPESSVESTEAGEFWAWHYTGLIADRDIRLDLPQKLNFAQRVAAKQSDFRALGNAAPLLVGLCLAALALVFRVENVKLRLESYLLIGLGIALYFPLLTFVSAALPELIAAILSFSVVAGLVVVFIHKAAGNPIILRQMGLLLAVFLGLFASGMISPWRGLMWTAGGVILVGMFMVLYAHRALLPEPPAAFEAERGQDPVDEAQVTAAEVQSEPPAMAQVAQHIAPYIVDSHREPEPVQSHCPYCARAIETDYAFCPGCGHDTHEVHRCDKCNHIQFVPAGTEASYCVHCGTQIMKTPR